MATTPLEWRVQKRDDYPTKIRIYGFDGKASTVADVMFEDDAKLICLAVNNYGEMLELLKQAADCLEGHGKHCDDLAEQIDKVLAVLEPPTPTPTGV